MLQLKYIASNSFIGYVHTSICESTKPFKIKEGYCLAHLAEQLIAVNKRASSVAAPKMWNALTCIVEQPPSLPVFCWRVKT